MNQILATSQPTDKKGNKGPIAIETIVKFFAIALIIFGVFMIGSGSYAMYKQEKERKNIPTKPTIVEENKDENTILLKITHDKAIDTVEYYWNNEQPQVIKGNGRKYIEQEIIIPGGTNTLYVKAKDINGQEISWSEEHDAPDIIQLEVVGAKLSITATNDKTISYMTYRWNNDDETKIDINANTLEQEIDIPKGENTITIVVVNQDNTTITKEQKIKGVLKPIVTIGLDDARENFVVKATDEVALQKIEFILDKTDKKRLKLENGEKEIEYKFPLHSGDNFIEVVAYNTDGITSDTAKVKVTK